jgi:hypothetical protein
MTSGVTPPRARLSHTPANLLEHEFAQERAAALGRLGRALEAALAALADFDAAHPTHTTLSPGERASRTALVAQAAVALWHFIVQREACGLRDTRHVVRDYRVPREVAARMGAMPQTTGRAAR